MKRDKALAQAVEIIEAGDRLASSGVELNISDMGKNSAIIVVDMIKGFVSQGALASPRAEALVGGIRDLCMAGVERGAQVLFLCDSHPEDSPEFDVYPAHCISGTQEAELADGLKGFGAVIEKCSTNGLIEPMFMAWIDERAELDTFIIVGVCADICVLQLGLSLKALSTRLNVRKRIIVPANLTDTFDAPGHGAEAVKAFALTALSGAGIEVVSGVAY